MGLSLSLLRTVKQSDIFFPRSPTPVYSNASEDDTKAANTTETLQSLVEKYCPSLYRPFVPPWWLFSGHLQTLYCVVGNFSKIDQVVYHRKYLRLKDGGTLGLDFTPPKMESLEDATPVIVVMHGLTGGSYEPYVRAILHYACKPAYQGGLGYRAVVVNFRGCAGVPLTTPQFYSAGHTDDIRQALIYIRDMYPDAPLLGLGFSLGANVLIRYLGQEKEHSRLAAGCALACPWDLSENCTSMQSTFVGRHVYSKGMASNLVRLLKRNLEVFSSYPNHVITDAMHKTLALKSPLLLDFDESFTRIAGGGAPHWPLESAAAYYAFASSHHVLPTVAVPLLALNSADDPVVQKVPVELSVDNPWTVVGVTPGGGHLGWFKKDGGRWMTEPVMEWMRMVVEKMPSQSTKGSRIYRGPNGFLMQEGRDDLGCKEIDDAGFVQADKGDLFQGL